MTDRAYIEEYKNMKSIKMICEGVGIDSCNLLAGKSVKNEKTIANLCKNEIIRMYNLIILGEKINGD